MIVGRTVNVEFSPHGAWEIGLPDDAAPLVCETLEEAQRIAYLCAVQRGPCELTVHDAYHRLILHRVIDADERSGATFSSPAPSPPKAASAAFGGPWAAGKATNPPRRTEQSVPCQVFGRDRAVDGVWQLPRVGG
jgi:hypothetical protein